MQVLIDAIKEKKIISKKRLSHPDYYIVAKFMIDFCKSGAANGLGTAEIAKIAVEKTGVQFNASQVRSMRDQLGLEWVSKQVTTKRRNANAFDRMKHLEETVSRIADDLVAAERRISTLASALQSRAAHPPIR